MNRSNLFIFNKDYNLSFENNLKVEERMNISCDSIKVVDSHLKNNIDPMIHKEIEDVSLTDFISTIFLLTIAYPLFILPFSPTLALSPDPSSRKFNEDK